MTPQRSPQRWLALLLGVALALGMAGIQVVPAHAAFPTALLVTDCTHDSGTGTLRAAVGQANGHNANDGIYFSCSGTIGLASTLTISGSMTIDGGNNNIVIDGSNGGSAVQLFIVNSGVTLGLSHLTLQNGSAGNGTGGAIDNRGTVTVTNSTLSSNSVSCSGGCLAFGGAIYNLLGTVTVTNSTLSNNSVSCSGNNCGAGGGAIFTNGGTVTVSNSTLSSNSVSCSGSPCGASGGGIDSEGTMIITGSTLSGNSATFGGAIYANGAATDIDSSTLSGNSAPSGFGGAIFNDTADQLDIDSSTLSGNSAPNGYGGAVFTYYWSSTVDILNGTILSSNSAAYGGAIAALDGSPVNITDSNLLDNSSTNGSGGAIYQEVHDFNNPGTVTLKYSTLFGNSASSNGGAIFNHDGTVTVKYSDLSDNSAAYGGSIYNLATLGLTLSTLWGNSASAGGAIYSTGGATITASTIAGNGVSTGGAAGAIYNGGGTLAVGASIIANNPAFVGGNCYSTGPVTDNGYNLTDSNGNCGFNNGTTDLIDTDPNLGSRVYNGGQTKTMAPQPGSPAIDKIPTSSTLCSSSLADQRGYARPDNGESACDIGAYESAYAEPTTLTVQPASGPYGATATVTATLKWGTTAVSGKTVSFRLNGHTVCGGTSQPACPSTNSSGVATLTNASLVGIAVGTYPSSGACSSTSGVSADFAGDTTYAASNGCNTLTVTTAHTSTSLASSANPAVVNHPFTYTATVSPVPDGGTVDFKDGGSDILGCAVRSVNTISGIATCTFSYSSTGQHTITAVFSGHAGFLGSTSSPLTQYVDSDLSGYPTLPGGGENLGNTNLSERYFGGANLTGASLTNSNFEGTNFTHATLTGANLSDSDFKGTSFAGANLTNANLSGSNFLSADFRGANLTGATLFKAQFGGTTLTSVIWNNTTCPDGTNSTTDGGTCVGHL